jgi:helicase
VDLREADKSVVLAALRGRTQTAERILENVGRQDPSMDAVEADSETAAQAARADADRDGQASLGDFG